MKKFLLGCAAVVVSAGASFATDLPARAPAAIYKATPAYSWSGLYGGISGGYGWGENRIFDDQVLAGATTKYKPAGGFGGVQIGYNTQFAPHWLIGSEIDLSAGAIDDSLSPNAGATGKDKFNAFGTARTRFGYVQDRSLIYVTAGAIWLRDEYTARSGAGVLTDSTQYHVGWVFGGGIEYAIDPRWSVKLEYLNASLDRSHDTSSGGAVRTFDPNFSIVRAGVNYRFGDGVSTAYMPVKAAAPRSNWSGSYLGLHGGYGRGDLHLVDGFLPASARFKPAGGYGGFQGGYNWLFTPNALLGVEVDSSFGDLKDNGALTGGIPAKTKIDDLGTARLRLGYLMTPETLVYATGGAAYAQEKSTDANGGGIKADHLGWTVGAGLEYKFAPEWSLKAEYLYADLGSFKDNNPSVAVSRNSDLTLNTVRVGINYYGPLIERLFTR